MNVCFSFVVPKYLKGLFDDTVQTLDRELSQALKLAFEFTGKILLVFMLTL